MRRRVAAVAAAGVLAVGLAGCGTTESESDTDLSSGSYTVTVDGKEITYQAAYLVDGEDAVIDGGTYEAAEADEVVFLVVNGGSLIISGATVTKSGDASSNDSQRSHDVSDDYNFYGMNSAVVVVGEGSSVTMADTSITADANGANAVIAVNSGAAEVTGTTITTSQDSSRGLHATYDGTITGSDLTITTAGAHSASVATDRGGGTVIVTGTNTFNTSGDGSPLAYSTGEISIDGVTGSSEISQVAVVEGKNSVTITNSDVTSSGGDAVMIYQSMSGDAADKDAASSVGSVGISDTTVTYTGDGPVFYFTNTSAELNLSNVTVETDAAVLGSADSGRWGNSGSNGAAVTWTVSGSTLTGDVSAGSSSSIELTLTDGATVTGSTSGSVTITEG